MARLKAAGMLRAYIIANPLTRVLAALGRRARRRAIDLPRPKPGCSGGGYEMIIGVMMTEIGKARKGMIAVAVVMLESVARRLMGTRRLSSGMMTLAVAGAVLLVAGGASAEHACVADDGSGDA